MCTRCARVQFTASTACVVCVCIYICYASYIEGDEKHAKEGDTDSPLLEAHAHSPRYGKTRRAATAPARPIPPGGSPNH